MSKITKALLLKLIVTYLASLATLGSLRISAILGIIIGVFGTTLIYLLSDLIIFVNIDAFVGNVIFALLKVLLDTQTYNFITTIIILWIFFLHVKLNKYVFYNHIKESKKVILEFI